MGIKYKVNEQFFATWSHEMAYVLGFWFADGSIEHAPAMRGHYIRVSSTDRENVERIRSAMESQHTIVHIKSNVRHKTKYLLRIGSQKLFHQLVDRGVLERKSRIVSFPTLPPQYIHTFVRGYFDGDGCVHLGKNSAGNISRLVTVFTSGSAPFLEKLCKTLHTHAGLPSQRKIAATQGGFGSAYQLRYGTRDSIRLYLFLYPEDGGNALRLKRKYDIFRRYFKLRGLRDEELRDVLKQKGPVVKW